MDSWYRNNQLKICAASNPTHGIRTVDSIATVSYTHLLLGDIKNAVEALEKLEYPTPTRIAQDKNVPVKGKVCLLYTSYIVRLEPPISQYKIPRT